MKCNRFKFMFSLVLTLGPIFINSIYSQQISKAKIWVSPSGEPNATGSQVKPFSDIAMAVRRARELRRLKDPSVRSGIEIILKEGVYPLKETLFIRPEDAGTISSPTTMRAAPGEKPVISGGTTISNWQLMKDQIKGLPAEARGKVWMAEAPVNGSAVSDFRQLYINNLKAQRARDVKSQNMNRILSWNHKTQSCWIPKPTVEITKGTELFIQQWWAIAILRVSSFEQRGDSVQLFFEQPESRIQSEHPWPAPWISAKTGNSAYYLSNAIGFLDEPGEWFLDKSAGKVYYWPRIGEDMNTAVTVAPALETLVKIEGTADRPVSYFNFEGIAFQHSTWLRPSQQGHVPLQSGMFLLDAYKLEKPGTPDKKGLENQAWVGRPPAAAELKFSHHISFLSCRFEHLGSTGIDLERGTHHDLLRGNVFKDISGTGIQVGVFSDEAQEAHLPWKPSDLREVCHHEVISNNLLTDIANEDWGAVGISAGYVSDVTIQHNDLTELSYMGISVGWGWTPTSNVMKNNKIQSNRIHRYGKHLYDVAAIYTLSSQPGTLITRNYADSIYTAPYAHDPHHWFYLYTDEGSSYITVKDNWTPTKKYLQNANGPGNIWQNNGPQAGAEIKKNAGLTQSYEYLERERAEASPYRTINHWDGKKEVKP